MSRVRLRLTAFFGLLFLLSGVVLLTILYLLVSNSPKASFNVFRREPGGEIVSGLPDADLDAVTEAARQQGERQHDAELHLLLVESGVALAIMVLLSVALGWLVAGRILRPLRTMTDSVQRISAHNLHERLDAQGQRDEMKDLSDTVDGLLERLEAALNAHKRFIANAAHELRTPLTVQRALLEETLTDPDGSLESFRQTFDRLLVNGKHQGRMLESLLTLAGSERGLDRREPVDLAAVTGQVVAGSATELRFETRLEPAMVSGDPALVERLVANLVDNAVGYNVPGGFVEVTTATVGFSAAITVVNTGPTIPAEQVARLFEPFQRLGRTVGRQGHHGLGLSIVRAIAGAHDAEIEAEARVDGGMAVTVTFPPHRRPDAVATSAAYAAS
jgi:signal transduction histidine kinase